MTVWWVRSNDGLGVTRRLLKLFRKTLASFFDEDQKVALRDTDQIDVVLRRFVGCKLNLISERRKQRLR